MRFKSRSATMERRVPSFGAIKDNNRPLPKAAQHKQSPSVQWRAFEAKPKDKPFDSNPQRWDRALAIYTQ